jgi:uncharacterized protein DUF1761
MMEVSINLTAVLLAALSTIVVGSIWYGKVGFGDVWMKLAHVKPDPKFTPQKAAFLYGSAFLGSLITAFVLAYMSAIMTEAMSGDALSDTILIGFLGWLGFTATRIHMHDSFETRRKKLTLLTASHEFVTIMVMSLIIGFMR